MRSSCEYQPHTMFSANRPPVKWSTVVHCLAATIGWIVGTWVVENIEAWFVTAPIPAAQANVS